MTAATKRTRFWPEDVPREAAVPQRTLWANLAAAAEATPDKAVIVFGGRSVTYSELKAQTERVAGWLQRRAGVKAGDRVLLFAQNSPEFIAAFYGVLRADAVVVPVNAMSTADDLAYFADDADASVVLAGADLAERALPVTALRHVLVLDDVEASAEVNQALGAQDATTGPADRLARWADVLDACQEPAAPTAGPDDLCVLPYTSGTTGKPKGCRHTHRTVQTSVATSIAWRGLNADDVVLGVAPMFHLLGLQNAMNLPIALGGTVALMRRWDRVAAGALMVRAGVTVWSAPPAMVIDFFNQPGVEGLDLTRLRRLTGGGAAMPEAVAKMLAERYGLQYNEAYGMTETASFLHANPIGRGKRQCLGVPTQGVDSRVIDPDTLKELPPGETGELVTSAPQVMLGYWKRPDADAEAFIEIDGRRFLRTGDLCATDDEGYFFMRDRLKRMISVSGYKVWPAEVENLLYGHPSVAEACVIARPDTKAGEAVKAFIVRKPDAALTEADLIGWAREHMAVYKAPRFVAFVDALPRSATGKVAWRELQERERAEA